MFKRLSRFVFALAALLALIRPGSVSADLDPVACVQEIERVCVHLEDTLETCLSERGDKLSASCRDELKTAMSAVQNPSGPATCISDVKRLCPHLRSDALAQCITDKQSSFSDSCQKYLQAPSQQ